MKIRKERNFYLSCRKIRRGGTPRLRHIDVTLNLIISFGTFFGEMRVGLKRGLSGYKYKIRKPTHGEKVGANGFL